MSKKPLQFIVIFLAVLIIICFVTLIAGMYLKITGNQNDFDSLSRENSLGLNSDEKIIDIEILNKNQVLIMISNSVDNYGIVYDIKSNNIVSIIKR